MLTHLRARRVECHFSLCWKESESLSVVSYSLRPHGLYPWNSPGQNTGVGSFSLLQGIFSTQGSNPGLPPCRWILYQLSHKGSPKTTGVGSLSLLQGIFLTQESNQDLLHCRWILYHLSYERSPAMPLGSIAGPAAHSSGNNVIEAYKLGGHGSAWRLQVHALSFTQ